MPEICYTRDQVGSFDVASHPPSTSVRFFRRRTPPEEPQACDLQLPVATTGHSSLSQPQKTNQGTRPETPISHSNLTKSLQLISLGLD
uniref:Uncharacterized protein n=1 Tax=Arundo donax TaxID=35708 RepID=A0A0A9DMI3_ARUDO